MAIRKRTVVCNTIALVADLTGSTIASVVFPATGKIKSIKAWSLTKTGANASQLSFYKSGAVGSTAAASTTAVNSAALDITSDAVLTAALTDANTRFLAGEVLYVKATTGNTTTLTPLSITIEFDC
jgi:hypothetical protein